MKRDEIDQASKSEGRPYQAPALEKGLDIVELLARSAVPLTRSDIAAKLGRSVGELYRMLHHLVERKYIAIVGDSFVLTTKLFELAHYYPPTQRLLTEATPVMHKLAGEIDQSCHLTVYSQGRQLVIAKVDVPSGMGFSVRMGSELDVLVSASGRVLLAFQDAETQKIRINEACIIEPRHDLKALATKLDVIAERGFEAAPSGQVRGLFAISFPIRDLRGNALAALTVPYADRIDQSGRKGHQGVEQALREATQLLTARLSGA